MSAFSRARVAPWSALLALAIGAAACAPTTQPVEAPRPVVVAPPPPPPEPVFRQVGTASWYGPGFHGRRTASGARYDQNGLTAAHRSLPLNTWVTVTNLENGRSVDVLVNDRGPYIRGRVLDLSRGAADALGMREKGLARIELVALEEAPKGRADGRTRVASRQRSPAAPARPPTPSADVAAAQAPSVAPPASPPWSPPWPKFDSLAALPASPSGASERDRN